MTQKASQYISSRTSGHKCGTQVNSVLLRTSIGSNSRISSICVEFRLVPKVQTKLVAFETKRALDQKAVNLAAGKVFQVGTSRRGLKKRILQW
jgi:hypothetical protein